MKMVSALIDAGRQSVFGRLGLLDCRVRRRPAAPALVRRRFIDPAWPASRRPHLQRCGLFSIGGHKNEYRLHAAHNCLKRSRRACPLWRGLSQKHNGYFQLSPPPEVSRKRALLPTSLIAADGATLKPSRWLCRRSTDATDRSRQPQDRHRFRHIQAHG